MSYTCSNADFSHILTRPFALRTFAGMSYYTKLSDLLLWAASGTADKIQKQITRLVQFK